MSKKKRMICHNYYKGRYINTVEYPSIASLRVALKGMGCHFRDDRIQNLKDDSEIIVNGDKHYEIEEGI